MQSSNERVRFIEPRTSDVVLRAEAGTTSTMCLRVPRAMPQCTISLEAEAASRVHLVIIAQGGHPIDIRQEALLRAGAHATFHHVSVGDGVTWSFVSRLEGPDAKSTLEWAFHVRGSERQKLTARTIFCAQRGGGEMTLRGVAEGRGHASCAGMIEIAEGGAGTQTYLTEDVLMLDPTAKIDAVPGLEIRTNDVKASHSATVSRVTPEDLFYFQSRGIDLATARAMYVEGYLGRIADQITEPALRDEVLQALFPATDLSIADRS